MRFEFDYYSPAEISDEYDFFGDYEHNICFDDVDIESAVKKAERFCELKKVCGELYDNGIGDYIGRFDYVSGVWETY